jgi:predicted dienelactone hydrolase
MSLMLRRLWVALASLAASACCSSLQRMPPKSLVFEPAPAVDVRITETADVWRDDRRNREVPVRIYAPEGATTPLPVVVFSHGIGENRDSYAWLGTALAQRGYLAVHVTHAGTDRAVLERGYRHLYRAVKQKENWVNRPLDISFVLDRVADLPLADLGRIAVAGHSAGAFTSFAVAGVRTAGGETLRDERVKVIVPMSMPRLDGVIPPDGYAGIEIPVLNLTGTCDTSLIYRTFPRHRRVPFESARAGAHYLVTIEGANHDSFVTDDPRHVLIVALTDAFLRAWLLDDFDARRWFDEPGRALVLGSRLAVEARTRTPRGEADGRNGLTRVTIRPWITP